jgi:hypothetical protein
MDDQAPSAGAMIVIAEGKRANEVIGEAELESGCPQFALGVDMEGGPAAQAALDGLSRQKAFTDAVRSEYRALDIRQTLARGSSASDGRGRRTIVEQTSSPAVAPRSTKPKAAEPEIDLDEITRLEAEAAQRGEFVDY